MPTAAELEQQLTAARIAEKEGARIEAERQEKLAEERERKRRADADEFRHLKAQAEAVLAEKPDKTRVMHDTRLYTRSMLANYVLGDGPPPQMGDPLWGSLHGLQARLVAFMASLDDEELYDAADSLECRLHRACLTRLRWLGGEVE